MAFTAKDVAALREKTGCGMMDCKKALTESDGDMDKAVEYLREKGLSAAAKKAGRIAAEGIVSAVVEGGKGVLLEVNSETDFVAKNADFQAFVTGCGKAALTSGASTVEELLAAKYDDKFTVEEMLREKILTIGENLKLRRFTVYEGVVETYIHGGGRIGVMVRFDTDCAGKAGFTEYAKDICMQIAAANPGFLDKAAVPADVLEEEKKILTAQAINEGKPAAIAEKMVMGRIGKFYKESCLLEQPFVKDADKSVAQYTAETAKALGGSIKVVQFVRYEKGEGIAKKEEDFAAEIAKMTGNK
jgi:elongation factor Ts